MLTGRYEAIPGEGQNVTPSTWNSMADSFRSSFDTINLVVPQPDESRKELYESIQAMQSAANAGDQGLGQKTANWFAGLAGSLIHPLSLATGEAAGFLASKGISKGAGLIGKYIPFKPAAIGVGIAQKRLGTIVGESAPKFIKDATVGGITKGAVSGFFGVTGFSLPEEIARTYNPSDNSFNWYGGVKSSFADGGVGLTLMSVPFLAGSIWGKLFKGDAIKPEIPMPHSAVNNEHHDALLKINKAEDEGRISKKDAAWFRDYLSGTDTHENLTNRAIESLIKDGHPVDSATKKVLFKIFTPAEIDQLQESLQDGIASNMPDEVKSLLHKFNIDTKIDSLRENQKALDGIEGVVSFIRKKLSTRTIDEARSKEFLRDAFPKSTKGRNPFSQKNILNNIKYAKEHGLTVPYQVEKMSNLKTKINALNKKVKRYERLFEKTNNSKYQQYIKNANSKIDTLTQKLPTLLKHNDELTFIKDKLMKDGVVKTNYNNTREFNRLIDLSKTKDSPRISNSAKRLIHELNVSHEYQMQSHYATALDAITKVMRSSVGRLANHNNVLNYMKERLNQVNQNTQKAEVKSIASQEKLEKKSDSSTIMPNEDVLKDYEQEMKNAPHEIKQEFDKLKNQFKEFNESPGIFKNLIKCVIGSLNG